MRSKILVVPAFAHPEKILCGPHCARFVLETHGLKYTLPWLFRRFPRLFPSLIPTFPGRMVGMLKGNGLPAKRTDVQYACRIVWLWKQIRLGGTPALFVRLNTSSPFPTHWIVVCGLTEEGNFLVYDDRIGTSAKNPSLDIGNTLLTVDELLKAWRPFFGKTSVAVTT